MITQTMSTPYTVSVAGGTKGTKGTGGTAQQVSGGVAVDDPTKYGSAGDDGTDGSTGVSIKLVS